MDMSNIVEWRRSYDSSPRLAMLPPAPSLFARTVGQTIQERARAVGFAVDWNEDIAERIMLTNFRWQRRSPGK
jgi:hypothetical protein